MILVLDSEILETAPEFNQHYNLLSVGCGVSTPEPRLNMVEVPGRNGMLDLTNALGATTYNNRNVWFASVMSDTTTRQIQRYSTLLNKYHGQLCKMVLDKEPDYYYVGRCSVSRDWLDNGTQAVRFDLDADPFKYPVYTSDDDWLWDPFNFNTGVIRKYRNLRVSGSRTVDVIAYEQPESPKFRVVLDTGQTSMRMTYDGDTYYLRNGLNSFPAIVIQSLDVHTDIHSFTFSGYGTVTIDLKGGIL